KLFEKLMNVIHKLTLEDLLQNITDSIDGIFTPD
ncbi:uncharacterized protein METZ01_LOCUS314734, partial [marine metagenome]